LAAFKELIILNSTTYAVAKADLEKAGIVEAVNNYG
jgi:hypothetical protein